MREIEERPKPMEGFKGQPSIEDPVSSARLYGTKDIKAATGFTSGQMVRRYLRRLIINNPNMESNFVVGYWGKGPKILLTEDAYKKAVNGIISLRGVPIELPTTFLDGTPIPLIKSRKRRELLALLLKAREEERLFHMQELLGPDLNSIPLEVERWSFSYHVNNLNREIQGSGWLIQGGHRAGHEKNLRGRKYSYFLRRDDESSEEQSSLQIKMQTKEQILSTASLLVLSHLAGAGGQEKQDLNRNINVLLEDALKSNFPHVGGLTHVFIDSSAEYLKKFFLSGFIYTLQTVPDRKGIYLSEEEKEIIDCCNRLKQNDYNTQRIINFAKLHFDIQNVDKPQPVAA